MSFDHERCEVMTTNFTQAPGVVRRRSRFCLYLQNVRNISTNAKTNLIHDQAHGAPMGLSSGQRSSTLVISWTRVLGPCFRGGGGGGGWGGGRGTRVGTANLRGPFFNILSFLTLF